MKIFLLIFASAFFVAHTQNSGDLPTAVQVQKCCPDGDRLNSSDPTDPRCVQHSFNLMFDEMDILGIDLTKDPGSRKVNMTLTFDAGSPGMPQCKGAKVFTILTENSWLTAEGNLVLDFQEHQMRHYEFCVNQDTDQRLGAVSCAPCTKDHPCVNLCCPHGAALVEDSVNPDSEICGTETLKKTFSPEFWIKHDMQMEEYGKEQGFILKAPAAKGGEFVCPDSLIRDYQHLYSDFNHTSFAVTPDGRLHGYNITYQHQSEAHLGNFSWDNDKFCVIFADPDYDYESESLESDGVFQLTFNTCYDNSRHSQSEASAAGHFRTTNKSQAFSKVLFFFFALSFPLPFNI